MPGLANDCAAVAPRTERDLTPPPADNTVALKRLAGLAKHLAETAEGERHGATYPSPVGLPASLSSIARTLGQLVASGHLTPQEIHDALHAATEQNGLLAEDRGNVTQTISDGIEKGISDGPDPD